MMRGDKGMMLDGHETVLYRTHTVILTDKRIVVDGYTYPLDKVTSVTTRRTTYYLPLIFFRAFILLASIALFIVILMGTSEVSSITQIVELALPLVIGSILLAIMFSMPTHVIWLESGWGNVNVLGGGDRRYLDSVTGLINETRIKVSS